MKKQVKQKHGQQGGRSSRLAGKLALVGLILAVLLAAVGASGLLAWKQLGQWTLFQITAIRIDGCVRTTKKQILDLSGADVHSNLLALSTSKIRARVEEHQWVERALVRREWPSRLQITVRERRPVALLSLPGGLYYLDRHGEPFARALPPEDLDFPVITGLPPVQEWQSEQRRALGRALTLIRQAGGGLILPAQGISEINLDEAGSMTLFLVSRPFPVHLGDGREITRDYNRLVQVLSRLYREQIFAETAAIRLDYLPDKVLVEKREGT